MTTPHLPDQLPEGLMAAFWDYERALMTHDLASLDRLFVAPPTTLRGDAAGLLVGHEAISTFRGGRSGVPARPIVKTHVHVEDAAQALVVAVSELERGGRGQQTQHWTRAASGWAGTAAHLSVPAPANDTRTWRVVGNPLVNGAVTGQLAGQSVAVKDVFAVAVQRVAGIAQTDELGHSLAGTNAHSGSPPNPRAPHRIAGGSSSGPACAVSCGHASIGLGTDTGGSVRVPAAYQGLYGIRTSHCYVPAEGLVSLSRSFDAVGWLTRESELLARVGDVLLPANPGGSDDLMVVPELLSLAEPGVARVIGEWAEVAGATREEWDLRRHAEWLQAFLILQAWEAWREHGPWLAARLHTVGPDVRARFEHASAVSDDAAAAAAVGDRVLVLPSESSVAPRVDADLQVIRSAAMLLTSFAGLAGLPAVSVPLTTAEGLPWGAALLAGRDHDLLRLAAKLPMKPVHSAAGG